MHHITSHGKRERDAGLAKEAPRAKKAQEMFVHKVKAMLKKNSCMTAMWTKTLKEKGIDGTTLKDKGRNKKPDDGEEEEEEEEEEVDDYEGESSNEDEEDDSDGSKSAKSRDSDDEYETDDD